MVRSLKLAACVVAASVSAVAGVQDTPIVLVDRGGIPIKELLGDPSDISEVESMLTEPNSSLEDPSRGLADGLYSESLYPVISKSLSVGPIESDEAVDLPTSLLTMPMFIIGYDRVSVNWMLNNLGILEENKAIGLVVNVHTPDQMRELVRLTEGRVALQPTPGDGLAEALNLRHYPAYIDHQGIMR